MAGDKHHDIALEMSILFALSTQTAFKVLFSFLAIIGAGGHYA